MRLFPLDLRILVKSEKLTLSWAMSRFKPTELDRILMLGHWSKSILYSPSPWYVRHVLWSGRKEDGWGRETFNHELPSSDVAKTYNHQSQPHLGPRYTVLYSMESCHIALGAPQSLTSTKPGGHSALPPLYLHSAAILGSLSQTWDLSTAIKHESGFERRT